MINLLKQDIVKIKKRTIILFRAMKIQFLSASVIPILLGTILSFNEKNGINWIGFSLALIGICSLHISANMFNDYFDHINGTDQKNEEFIRPFTGGSRAIQDGVIEPYRVLIWAAAFLIAGSVIGAYIVFKFGFVLLFLGLIGIVSVIFYVNRKFSLAALGLGELTIFLNFGPLPVVGSYYIQTGKITYLPFLISLPIGFLITAVLYVNQFPDYKADKDTNKNNLVVRLGRKKARWGYVILITLTYLLCGIFLIFRILPIPGLIIFLSIPVAFLSIKLIIRYYEKIPKLVTALPATILLHITTGYFIIISFLYERGIKPLTYLMIILIAGGLVYLVLSTISLYKSLKKLAAFKEVKID